MFSVLVTAVSNRAGGVTCAVPDDPSGEQRGRPEVRRRREWRGGEVWSHAEGRFPRAGHAPLTEDPTVDPQPPGASWKMNSLSNFLLTVLIKTKEKIPLWGCSVFRAFAARANHGF